MSVTFDSSVRRFDESCWSWDGLDRCVTVIPPVVDPVPYEPTGGGSGGYRGSYDDMLQEARKNLILREDIEILEFVKIIITKGIL